MYQSTWSWMFAVVLHCNEWCYLFVVGCSFFRLLRPSYLFHDCESYYYIHMTWWSVRYANCVPKESWSRYGWTIKDFCSIHGGVKDDNQMENLLSLSISSDPFEPEKDGPRAGCDCEEGGFRVICRESFSIRGGWYLCTCTCSDTKVNERSREWGNFKVKCDIPGRTLYIRI